MSGRTETGWSIHITSAYRRVGMLFFAWPCSNVPLVSSESVAAGVCSSFEAIEATIRSTSLSIKFTTVGEKCENTDVACYKSF